MISPSDLKSDPILQYHFHLQFQVPASIPIPSPYPRVNHDSGNGPVPASTRTVVSTSIRPILCGAYSLPLLLYIVIHPNSALAHSVPAFRARGIVWNQVVYPSGYRWSAYVSPLSRADAGNHILIWIMYNNALMYLHNYDYDPSGGCNHWSCNYHQISYTLFFTVVPSTCLSEYWLGLCTSPFRKILLYCRLINQR
jgi:hypothetical protein